MAGLFGSTDALSRLLESYEVRRQQARDAILATVVSDMQIFPLVLLDDDELPTFRVSLRHRVRLFPLGECRRIWLPGLTGHTTLFFGSDGQLYEYGPRQIDSYSMEDNPFSNNSIELRGLVLDRLDVGHLMACRDLLRRVWLV